MASLPEVKQYLAHWFQLGRKVYIRNGDVALLPNRVFQDLEYSAEFEQCWNLVTAADAGDCYLEDTTQTISELLSSRWDLVDCARCNMPVPLPAIGAVLSDGCPCVNIAHWPNDDMPAPIPRTIVSSKIQSFQQRLKRASNSEQ
jgi:hypothetical protein